MSRTARRCLPVMIAAGVLSACGVSAQEHPDVIGGQPLGARSAQPNAPSEATRGAHGVVYLVRGTRLVAVRRSAEVPAEAVTALLLGPTVAEAGRGIRTAVPAGIAALEVQVRDGVATIDVPADLTDLAGTEQILAVAQLVFTVTGDVAVDGVVLTSVNRQVHAPTDSGQLVSRPVTRADYRSVRPV